MAWSPSPGMPLDQVADRLATQLAGMYADVEARLVAQIAQHARTHGDAPEWASERLAAVRELRDSAEVMVTQLQSSAREQVAEAIVLAHRHGSDEAVRTLAELGGLDTETAARLDDVAPSWRAAERIIADTSSTVEGVAHRITRWADDAYRVAVAAAAAESLVAGDSIRLAQHRAWTRLVSTGITGFVDTSGRGWNLASYVEMATRTAMARAWQDAHQARMSEAGVNTYRISSTSDGCARCAPWSGRIVTRDIGVTESVNPLTGERERVQVDGTIDQARAAGLWHPNCRHTLLPHMPGVSYPDPPPHDPQAEEDREHQRYLERKVREWKRRQAGALTDAARRDAAARVRGYQARIRDHVATTGLVRRRHREQLNLGSGPTPQGRGALPSAQSPRADSTPPRRPPVEVVRLARRSATEPAPSGALARMSDGDVELAMWQAQRAGDWERAARAEREWRRRALRRLTDERLDADMAHRISSGDYGGALEVEAELERRHRARERSRQQRQARKQRQADELERLLAEGVPADVAMSEAYGMALDTVRRRLAIDELRAQGYRGRGFDELARESYRDEVSRLWVIAEDATRGHYLKPQFRDSGVDLQDLYTMPLARARKYASEELLRHWQAIGGRLTYRDWRDQLLGDPGAIARRREGTAGGDFT